MTSESIDSAGIAAEFDALRQQYLRHLPGEIAALQSTARQLSPRSLDFDALAVVAAALHRLAGSAGTFGVDKVGDAAKILNALAKALPSKSVPDQIRQLAELQRGLQRLQLLALAVETPATAMPAASSAPTGLARVGAVPWLLWLIDDDSLLAAALDAQLSAFGFFVRRFDRLAGAEAAAQAGDAAHVLLMDVHLSREEGNATERLSHCPALLGHTALRVFMSAEDDFHSRLRAVELGASAYVLKPLDVPRLATRLMQMLSGATAPPSRVLMLDTDGVLSDELLAPLIEQGLLVERLDDPSRLRETLGAQRPEILMIDEVVGTKHGHLFAGLTRQYEAWSTLPILIALRPGSSPDLKQVHVHADGVVRRPVSPADLAARIDGWVRRSRQLQDRIVRDGLTGLLTHAAIKDAVETEVSRCRRRNERMAVAMVDIDRFKSVNDTYGHATGDVVISAVAMLLRQRLRRTDLIGRYGGEEFAIVLPDCGLDQAIMLLEDVRTSFAKLRFSYRERAFAATLSAGLCSTEQFGQYDGAQLLAAADVGLYVAKNSGRNRVRAFRDGVKV